MRSRLGKITPDIVEPSLPYEYYGAVRRLYNRTKQRWEQQIRYGDEWFVFSAIPSYKVETRFIGLLDITVAFNMIITDVPLRSERTGLGTFTDLNILRGGARMTTGVVIGNDCTLGQGDNTGFTYPWNVSEDIDFYARYRFPNAADLNDSYLLEGLYADANNYICIRYDRTVDDHLRFVTRRAGVETLTDLGAADNNWHAYWAIAKTDIVKIVFDGGPTITHTTNIPIINLTQYAYLQTLAGASKNFDFQHLITIQDHE